jgi:glutathione S-transferase
VRPSLWDLTRQISGAFFSGLTDSAIPATRRLRIVGGFAASGLRLATGMTVAAQLGPRPVQRLRLWDVERCAESRCVREALSTLDLDADVRPCPSGGARFRPELGEAGATPQLEDANTGATLRGAADIVTHLYAHYGVGPPPAVLNAAPVRASTGAVMVALAGQRGAVARPSKAPPQPLHLWSFEASPYCRMVRETLCELELPYVLHNLAKGSPRRDAFIARVGKMQVPLLEDPNTGTSLFESLAIERYLEATWGAP